MTLPSFHLPLAIELGPDGFWWAKVLVFVGIYALLGLSLNLINGYARMFSLGHHGFWAMGAYASAWLSIECEGAMPGPLLFVVATLFAMIVAGAGGLLIGVPCLRLRGDYLAIATLGFGEIVRLAAANTQSLGGSQGLSIPRVIMVRNPRTKGDFEVLFVTMTAVLVAAVALLIRNYIRSSKGRAMLATAQDETAAGLLGINPTRSKVAAFVMGSMIAGLAGSVFAHYSGNITPLDFGFMKTVMIFLIIVLGGLGSLSGCILAAFLLIFADQYLNSRLPESLGWVKDWWQVEYALLLILLMIFRPRGIFGSREVSDVFRAVRARLRKKASGTG